MQDLSLHILDIAENSIEAGATKIEIVLKEDEKKNQLSLRIKDNGKGMNKKTLSKIQDPFYTTKMVKKVGLGISMLAQATREADGKFEIKSYKNKGTTITATFAYDHIDRKPIGDMAETIIALIANGGLEIDFIYKHYRNSNCFVFDTKEVKKELKGIEINNAHVLNLLKKEIANGLKKLIERS